MPKTITAKQQCEQHAKRLGCELEFRIDGIHANLEAVAPDGYCFEPSLHCLVEFCFKGGKAETAAHLYGEMLGRLERFTTLEKCKEGCDCHDII